MKILPPPRENRFKISMILCSIMLIAASIPASAQTDHRIVFIKNLIQDAAEAQWTDGADHSLNFNGLSVPYGTVKRGQKLGGINGSAPSFDGKLVIDETVSADSIDIEFAPTFGRSNSLVRGVYTVKLPELKRIQLEAMYDLFLDSEGERSPADFYVEVFEKDAKNPSEWIKQKETRREGIAAALPKADILNIGEEQFNTFDFLVNLTPWAGKEIRIALTANIPAEAIADQKGRWLSARLVGSTFDFQLGPPEDVNDTAPSGKKASRNSSNLFKPYSDFDITGATEELHIYSVINCPDSSLTTAFIKGGDSTERWFGYFHGLMEPDSDFVPDATQAITRGGYEYWTRGTMAFDLENFTSPLKNRNRSAT